MALSTEQTLALFEILEVPYDTAIHKLMPNENMVAVEVQVSNTAMQAYTLINSRITEVEADADLLAVLVGYLDQWIALGTNVTTLDGGFDGITGLSDDPDRERIVIRGRVLVIVPFYRKHEEIRGTLNRNISIDIMR